MKKISRFLSILLCLAILLPLGCLSVFASEESDGELEWAVEGGTLWIHCSGEMSLKDGIPWEAVKSEITGLRIDEGLTEIGPRAFADCTALRSVSLPKSLKVIHEKAFLNCSALNWVTFPEGLLHIGDFAFFGCGGLKNVFIPEQVGAIGTNAFDKTVTLNAKHPSAAEDYAAQKGCGFVSLGLRQPVAKSGSWGDELFWTLDDGLLTVAGHGAVEPLSGSVYPWEAYRADIRVLVIDGGITSIGDGAFRSCGNLAELHLPESLTAIGEESFRLCGKLESVLLPVGVKNLAETAFDATVELLTSEIFEEAQTEEAAPVEAPIDQPAVETEIPAEAPSEMAVETTQVSEATEAIEETVEPESIELPEETEPQELPAEEPEEPEAQELALTLSRTAAISGRNAVLTLSLENNPGICGLNFGITYDRSRLTLTGYDSCGEGMHPEDWLVGMDGSQRGLWMAAEVYNRSGDILTLTFLVSEDCADGEIPVTLWDITAIDPAENLLSLEDGEGCVLVRSGIIGDLNEDGEVTAEDSNLLKAHLAGVEQEINLANADINGDGRVNLLDALRLNRFLSGLRETLE